MPKGKTKNRKLSSTPARRDATAVSEPTPIFEQSERSTAVDQSIAALWSRVDRTWIHVALITLLTSLVFANSLKNSFHLDDYYRVVNNPGIQQVSRPWLHFVDPTTMSTLDRIGGYRPFLPLTLSINYALAGDSVVSYHVGNLLLQVINACLVYWLMIALLSAVRVQRRPFCAPGLARAVALCVALLFAVHPVSGIPVNYICARDQLLSQMFWSGSLLCYLRMSARGFSVRMLAISLGLLFASLLSKGDAVLAPLVILALELTILGQPLASRRPWLRAAAFAVPVASLFILQRVAFGESEVTRVVSEGVSRTDYALTQARLHLFRYLPQFVWPFPIRQDPAIDLDHGLSLPVVCGGLFIGASLWFAWRWRREHPIASFCIATYWLMMATTSSVIPLYHIAVDYRPYPSSPFLYLALAVLALRLTLPARTALATGAIVWCAATSIFLNQTWRDDKALWSYSVEHGAGPLAHHNLAMATTDLKTRKELLEKALELAPTYFLAMINLGRALVSEGQVTRGLEYLQRAVLLTPRDAQTRFWYARTLAEAGKVKEASRESVIAAELNPSREAIMQAVMATQAAGDMEESQRWLSRLNGEPTTAIAAAVDADNDPRFGRAFTLQQQGKLDEAITVYRDFLKTYPDHAQVHFNLGYALKDKHQCQEAIRELERALELDSSKTAAHLHIAICSRELGNAQLAQLHQKTWDASQQAAVH